MAGLAFLRCRLIKKYSLTIGLLHEFVTSITTHIAMSSLQGESGALIVVKQRRFPSGAVVALYAGSNAIVGKLLAVGIFMALLAFRWS